MSKALASPAAAGLPNQAPAIEPPLDLNAFPDRYGMVCQGACLEPDVPDKSILAFSKSEPYARGDFVVLYWRPEFVKPGRLQGVIKRLVTPPPPWVKFPWREHPESDVKALVLVEMLNPRQQLVVPCAELLAIHKCLGLVPNEHMSRKPVRRASQRRHANG